MREVQRKRRRDGHGRCRREDMEGLHGADMVAAAAPLQDRVAKDLSLGAEGKKILTNALCGASRPHVEDVEGIPIGHPPLPMV